MSSLNHVSVTATMSTGLIESDAVNSSNFGKSDRAFIKEIFGNIFVMLMTYQNFFLPCLVSAINPANVVYDSSPPPEIILVM